MRGLQLAWLLYYAMGIGFVLGVIVTRRRDPGEHAGWVMLACFLGAPTWLWHLPGRWRRSAPNGGDDAA